MFLLFLLFFLFHQPYLHIYVHPYMFSCIPYPNTKQSDMYVFFLFFDFLFFLRFNRCFVCFPKQLCINIASNPIQIVVRLFCFGSCCRGGYWHSLRVRVFFCVLFIFRLFVFPLFKRIFSVSTKVVSVNCKLVLIFSGFSV